MAAPRRLVCQACAVRQVWSDSGKALWHIRPTRNATFNTLVCLQRGVLVEAAVSVYRAGELAWCGPYPVPACLASVLEPWQGLWSTEAARGWLSVSRLPQLSVHMAGLG